MRPNLGDVQNIKSVFLSIFFRHELNVEGPRWEVSFIDGVVEITGREVLVFQRHFVLLFSSKVFDALISFEMIFDKMNFTFVIHPFEGMGGVSIHEPVAIRSTAI